MKKEFPYIVVLANTIRRPAYFISWLLVLITLASGMYFTLSHLSRAVIPLLVMMMIMIIVLIVSLRRTKKDEYPSFFWAIVVAALCWRLLPGGYYMLLLLLLAALLERQSHIPVEIGIDKEGITFNHFPTRFYSWGDIQRCLVKEGLLTIDYKNNRLYQKEVAADITQEDEIELNQFCADCIQESSLGGSDNPN